MAKGLPHRTFDCPHKALQALSSQSARVVVTDFFMPRMRGAEFIGHARRICPDAHFIMVTGTPPASFAPGEHPDELLVKPIDIMQLRRKLHELTA